MPAERIIATHRRTLSTPRGASDFTPLAQQIRDAGLLRRRYGYYWTKLIAVPIVLGALVVGFVFLGDTWWQLFTATAFAVLFTQIAFLGHDAAHRQIFASGRWNDWIEHHLFPSMPRPQLRQAAPVVAEYCRRLGVPYTQTGLFASYAIVVRYINRVGLGERDAFACPLVVERQSI